MATAAIPTKYNGVQFRSRIEAKWAAFMDLLDWSWEYEPLDFDGYIPDFWVNDTFWLEVKAAMTLDELRTEAPKVFKALESKGHDAIIVGGRPIFDEDTWYFGGCGATMGIAAVNNYTRLPEYAEDGTVLRRVDDGFFDTAEWRADCCQDWSTGTSASDWTLTCGCDHKAGGELDLDLLRHFWREASNITQWQPRERGGRA